jgi:hypothetical protein
MNATFIQKDTEKVAAQRQPIASTVALPDVQSLSIVSVPVRGRT